MEQQTRQQIEQQLRSNWQQISQQILQSFTTVSKADVDSAQSTDDLVRRIADKAHYTERYVETRLTELVLASSGSGSSGQQQPFSSQSGSQSQSQGSSFSSS